MTAYKEEVELSIVCSKVHSCAWNSLVYIPKGILEKIRKVCFKFLWSRREENEGIPQVKWNIIPRPKEEGGWGPKNIHLLNISLEFKSFWRVLN